MEALLGQRLGSWSGMGGWVPYATRRHTATQHGTQHNTDTQSTEQQTVSSEPRPRSAHDTARLLHETHACSGCAQRAPAQQLWGPLEHTPVSSPPCQTSGRRARPPGGKGGTLLKGLSLEPTAAPAWWGEMPWGSCGQCGGCGPLQLQRLHLGGQSPQPPPLMGTAAWALGSCGGC